AIGLHVRRHHLGREDSPRCGLALLGLGGRSRRPLLLLSLGFWNGSYFHRRSALCNQGQAHRKPARGGGQTFSCFLCSALALCCTILFSQIPPGGRRSMANQTGLRQLRRDRGLTLEAASYLSKLDIATWSKVERGLVKPTPETVVKMTRALGISIE